MHCTWVCRGSGVGNAISYNSFSPRVWYVNFCLPSLLPDMSVDRRGGGSVDVDGVDVDGRSPAFADEWVEKALLLVLLL